MSTSNERISHTLFTPINVDGVERRTIEVRRMRTRDIRDVEKVAGGGLEKAVFLIQRLSGWPPEAIDELDAADLVSLGAIIEVFSDRKA